MWANRASLMAPFPVIINLKCSTFHSISTAPISARAMPRCKLHFRCFSINVSNGTQQSISWFFSIDLSSCDVAVTARWQRADSAVTPWRTKQRLRRHVTSMTHQCRHHTQRWFEFSRYLTAARLSDQIMLRVTREVVTCDVVRSKNIHKALDKTRRMHYAADQIAYFDECIRSVCVIDRTKNQHFCNYDCNVVF